MLRARAGVQGEWCEHAPPSCSRSGLWRGTGRYCSARRRRAGGRPRGGRRPPSGCASTSLGESRRSRASASLTSRHGGITASMSAYSASPTIGLRRWHRSGTPSSTCWWLDRNEALFCSSNCTKTCSMPQPPCCHAAGATAPRRVPRRRRVRACGGVQDARHRPRLRRLDQEAPAERVEVRRVTQQRRHRGDGLGEVSVGRRAAAPPRHAVAC